MRRSRHWLQNNGYRQPLLVRYGEWLGVMPGWTGETPDGRPIGRCLRDGTNVEDAPAFCGVLQGDFGFSSVFKEDIGRIISSKLGLTGILMFWVMVTMVPTALVVGVLAGMREGSKTDRGLSTFSILSTSTPEYVSGVIMIVVFASSLVRPQMVQGNSGFRHGRCHVRQLHLAGRDHGALRRRVYCSDDPGVDGRGDDRSIHPDGEAQRAELQGLVVLKHALRNALIAPFTVIMLQFPWLLTGVVVVETLFNYKGFGWTLVQAAGNNDIELLMACSVVAVIVLW